MITENETGIINKSESIQQIAHEHPKAKAWLDECRASSTRRSYSARIDRFFQWVNLTSALNVDEFLALPPEEKRHLALQFQNQKDLRANTACSILAALNSFLDCYEQKINFKGKVRRREMDILSHTFSNGDLSKIFELGNTKEKALISLACSLGWEVSSILGLPRKQLQGYIDRAKEEGKQYSYFMSQRPKTGAVRLGVLNPLALEWVDKWLTESKDDPHRKRKADKITADRVVSDVFDLTEEGANKMLRRLAREAHFKATGRVHFHKLRGWVMSGLSRASLNEFQIKFLMGKTIPPTDMTYLASLQQEIEERYPKAYEEHLNLQKPIKAVFELNKSLEQKSREMEALQAKFTKLELQFTSMAAQRILERPNFNQDELETLHQLLAEKAKLLKESEENLGLNQGENAEAEAKLKRSRAGLNLYEEHNEQAFKG